MKRDNFYRIIIIALLLLNLGTLAYLWAEKRDMPGGGEGHPPRPDMIINERLQLNYMQREQFNGFRKEHHSRMVELQEQSSALHKELFALLKQQPSDAAAQDSIINKIQVLNREKELVTYDHFRKLRSILNPKQQIEFDDFVEEISERILGPHHEGRP